MEKRTSAQVLEVEGGKPKAFVLCYESHTAQISEISTQIGSPELDKEGMTIEAF